VLHLRSTFVKRKIFRKGRAVGEIYIARAPDWLIANLPSTEDDDGQAGSKVDGNSESVGDKAEPVRLHPYANIFPMLAEERLHELAQDIKDRGLVDPIMLYEGQILDGRCRYLACQIASVEPRFKDYVGDDPLGFVVSRNLHRRHLTESQRALVAARLAALKRGANQHSQGLPIGRAADLLNVGERSVGRARDVLRRGVPELVTAVEAGEIAVSAAADISGMPESEQRKMIASTPGGSTNADGEAGIKKAGKSAMRKTGKSKKQAAGIPGAIAPAAEVEKLKSELAAANERQRKLEEELEIARVTALESRAASSIKISPDLEIPPFLDRRPLADDQAAFDSIMAAWTNRPPRMPYSGPPRSSRSALSRRFGRKSLLRGRQRTKQCHSIAEINNSLPRRILRRPLCFPRRQVNLATVVRPRRLVQNANLSLPDYLASS
jgi:ParB-like chromosome segregation protein Spo0J